MHEHEYQIAEVTQLTYTRPLYRVCLKPIGPTKLHYRAGQYLHLQINGIELPFSIGNAQRADHMLELYLRYKPNDALVRRLLTKKKVIVQGPFGSCVYPKETATLNMVQQTLFVAGGTGIAPVKAIMEQIMQMPAPMRPIALYWGVRDSNEFQVIPVDEWQKHLLFQYIPILSARPTPASWQGRTGWVHETVLSDFTDLSKVEVYAFGPLAMLHAAWSSFSQRGLAKEHFYTDVPLN